eukprot:6620196-Prymnesium_polylepis.1
MASSSKPSTRRRANSRRWRHRLKKRPVQVEETPQRRKQQCAKAKEAESGIEAVVRGLRRSRGSDSSERKDGKWLR